MNIHLTPEIEAGLGAEAAARGVSVDALVAEAVGEYLRRSGGVAFGACRVETGGLKWLGR